MRSLLILFLLFFATPTLAEENPYLTLKEDRCYGGSKKLPDEVWTQLMRQQISEKDLIKGISCFQGDFNGDGATDYALLPYFDMPDTQRSVFSHWKAAVIFIGKEDAVPTAVIVPTEMYRWPKVYPRPLGMKGQQAMRVYGCPVDHATDGIIEWGEGVDPKVYLWDPQSKSFTQNQCAGRVMPVTPARPE